jgi:hypothetical protein
MEIFFSHLIELLGVVDQMEPHFSLFGDNVNQDVI